MATFIIVSQDPGRKHRNIHEYVVEAPDAETFIAEHHESYLWSIQQMIDIDRRVIAWSMDPAEVGASAHVEASACVYGHDRAAWVWIDYRGHEEWHGTTLPGLTKIMGFAPGAFVKVKPFQLHVAEGPARGSPEIKWTTYPPEG